MLIFILAILIPSAQATSLYPCPTKFDQLGIPKVEVTSVESFYYCFGLSHGRDRAWEMDYFRRVGKGRNAEVLGYNHLKSDLMMKLLNLPKLAEKIWIGFSPEKKNWIQIYADGVNEGFKTGKRSKEFEKLDYYPEAWEPQDSLMVLLLQSFDQTRKTFYRDYEEEKTKYKWGAKSAQLFDEDNMPWANTILKDGEYLKEASSTKTTSTSFQKVNLWQNFPSVFGEESGSNNWAISKSKSKTGNAILANDPHLDLKTPMFWYWANFVSREFKVIGASVPGVPVIVSGTNSKVAWGLTNSYMNSADALLIKNVRPEEIESFRPLVMIKIWFFKIPFIFKSFERLKSGHILLPLEIKSDNKLVLRWSGFELAPEEIYPMFDLFKANDVGEMDQTLSKVGVPSWNFVFADSKGDIGYKMVGKTYRHLNKTTYGIPSISIKELDHVEYLHSSEVPQVLKPKRAYVHSANNRHWPADSRFYGGRGYSQSFRGFRIDELLIGNHDIASFKKIQCDQQIVDARFFVPKLQKYLKLSELDNWNMNAEDSSIILPLYRRLIDLMLEKWEVNEYALFRLLDNLNIDQQIELKAIHVLAKSQLMGRNWGQIHRVKFPHLSKDPNFHFSPDLAGVGDTHSINPGTATWNADAGIYEQTSGASMRMIIEMSTPPKIWLGLPGINRHYDHLPISSAWESWKNCQYSEVQF